MSERLESVQKRLENAIFFLGRSSGKTQVFNDIKWLIQQADDKEELKKDKEILLERTEKLEYELKQWTTGLENCHENFKQVHDEKERLEKELRHLHNIHSTLEDSHTKVKEKNENITHQAKHWLEAYANLQSEHEEMEKGYEGYIDFKRNQANSLQSENERLREAWNKAKAEAKEYGAGKLDEDIPDDDKEEAYRLGADDMFGDFVDEYRKALRGDNHE